jgi:TonB family protein
MDYPLPLFHTTETPHTPWSRWLTSFGIHAAFLFILIAVPVAASRSITAYSHYVAVRLEDPRVIPSPVIPPPVVKVRRPEPVVRPNPAKVLPIVLKRITPPPIKPVLIEPPKIEAVRAPEPKFDLPSPPAPKPASKTGILIANNEAPAGPKPVAHEVKLGGFGDPNGVHATSDAPKGLTIARVGAFDLPSGPGQGGANGHARTVAQAGFGSAGATGSDRTSSGHANGTVHPSGFGDYTAVPVSFAAKPAPSSSPAVTPVEITFKPKPAYTNEARQQKLEGEVQLDVVFAASGQVHVVRVVRGLGLGLDESARAAAAQIRFRPGTKEGSPVDMRGTVHIVFELS